VTHRLAVRLDSLGDVLVTGPAVRALAATSDRLTLLCGPRGRAAAELLPGVDEVICWEAPWIDAEPDPVRAGEVAALVARLAALRVDQAVVFTSFHQSALPTALALRLAGVPWVGAVSRDYPGSLLDLRLPEPGRVPEAEAQLRLALASGGQLPPGDEGRLQVRLGDQDRQPPFDGEPPRSPYVVLHPGTSVPARAWPVEHYRKVAGFLAGQHRQVVVTGAPDERDLTAAVAAGPGTLDLGGRTDLAGLAAVLRDAEAVVVGNTGPAHLAAAVGTPVVSLFAPTVPAEVWAPYGVPVVLLGDQQAPCRDSRAATCPVAGHPCLASVTPTEVLAAIRQVGGSERTADAGPAEQEVPVRRAPPEPALEGGVCR
jgi:ADP-heptose:LPS heptosyltransferase